MTYLEIQDTVPDTVEPTPLIRPPSYIISLLALLKRGARYGEVSGKKRFEENGSAVENKPNN